ncbi:hypothetical protein [Rhodococcus sp. DK176]|uniref:hypothetical protein n=1 Tax=Rhodococcus sp. DK176 TaxID=3027223 RepID=UPI00037F19C6
MSTVASGPLASAPLPTAFVLAGRSLRPGVQLADTSRFSDDVWRLKPAIVQVQERTVVIDFLTLPERFRPAARRLFYSLLCQDLEPPIGEKHGAIASVRSAFGEIKRFLIWLDARWPAHLHELSAISPTDLDAYNRHLLKIFPRRRGAREAARAAVRLLWRWRGHLGPDRLQFDPLHLDGWGEDRPRRDRENTTDRLPEDVLGPLLVWALRFIDDFSADILAADRLWRSERTGNPRPVSHHGVDHRLQELLDRHVAERRPLPGYQGQPNVTRLAALIGCHRRDISSRSEIIDAAAAAVGIADAAFIDTDAITGTLDGKPWVTAINTSHALPTSLAALARHLQIACYITTAFLSGMRDVEIKHIKRGCVEVKRDEDGRPYRWKIHSRAFKGENDVTGVDATWTVCDPVTRAVRVLEQLQEPGQDYLLGALPHVPGQAKGDRKDRAIGVAATNNNLNLFVDFVNSLCQQHGRTDTIAAGSGALRLKTRIFRRTLAWFIARHPGGVVAGALHYRHHSIQMFEGYAGTSDSGFRAEVDSEQAIARGEVYMEMIDSHQHVNLAGPSSAEAARRLTEFGHHAQFEGQVVLDAHRLKRIMKRHDPAIYPGIYITCVNDPAKALCEKARRGNSEDLPAHGGCQPLACQNVALTAENIRVWRTEITRIDEHLGQVPLLAPRLQTLLTRRRQKIVDFLKANGQEHSPE